MYKTAESVYSIPMAQTEITMPAGTYFVGDPCYAVSSNIWDAVCGEAFRNEELWANGLFVATVSGHTVVGVSTAYGDGVYEDQNGRSYPVDAGMIGVVPFAVAEAGAGDGMHVITFSKPFTCLSGEHGEIHLGDIVIQTGDEDEDEDEECWDCGYDAAWCECGLEENEEDDL